MRGNESVNQQRSRLQYHSQSEKRSSRLYVSIAVFEKPDFLLRSTSIGLPLIFLVIHAWLSETPAINDAENAGDTNSSPNLNDPAATSTALRFRIQRVANVISAFSAAMGLSEGCTVMVKLWVQRRRPNFYALCGFDAANQKCMGTLEHIREVSRNE